MTVLPRKIAHPVMAIGLIAVLHAAERPYVNDLKVPESRKDLDVIQSAVIDGLKQTRAATVCIKVGDASGTGVVVSPEGLVMTAAHVSSGVGIDVKMFFEDGTEVTGKTLGLESNTDAALIQIVSPERKDWPHVKINTQDASRLGDWVFALGHSGGFDKDRGVVVRVGRLVKLSENTLHSDCILIGGDSGGPLFNLSGELIGIHSRVGNALQQNMHVPCGTFKKYWDEMMKSEFIGEGPFATKPVTGNGFLGIATEAHSDGGIIVKRVGADSPAEKAGIKVGDILLKANETELASREDLKAMLKEMTVGDEIAFECLRDGEAQTIKLKLGER